LLLQDKSNASNNIGNRTGYLPGCSAVSVCLSVSGLHGKQVVFAVDFSEPWIFKIDFQRMFKYQISSKSTQREPICSVRTEKRRTDGQTCRRFSQFCERASSF